MARQRKAKAGSTPQSARNPDEEPTRREVPRARPRRRGSGRDVRPFVYAGFDLLFAIVYLVLLVWNPNRHLWAQILLCLLPVLVVLMGAGTLVGALTRRATVARLAWIGAIAAGAAMVLVTIVVLTLLLMSAAFLAGVYGAIGQGAALAVLATAALVVELCAILPVFQIKYLMTRAGRRAFGLPPRGRAA
jgi:hypothetical protein